jgi:hypothetical protein
MRIQYTLPGLQPAVTTQAKSAGPISPTFKNRMQQIAAGPPVSWKQILRLDRTPAGPGSVGPPPKPATLEVLDVASERLRWRNLLVRHGGGQAQSGIPGAPPKVQRMVAVLTRMQELEDALIARSLSETGG